MSWTSLQTAFKTMSDIMGNGNRSFPLGRIILLYAIVIYLEHWPEISEEQFARGYGLSIT